MLQLKKMKFYKEATNPQLCAAIVLPSIRLYECHGSLNGSWNQVSVTPQTAKHPIAMHFTTISGS